MLSRAEMDRILDSYSYMLQENGVQSVDATAAFWKMKEIAQNEFILWPFRTVQDLDRYLKDSRKRRWLEGKYGFLRQQGWDNSVTYTFKFFHPDVQVVSPSKRRNEGKSLFLRKLFDKTVPLVIAENAGRLLSAREFSCSLRKAFEQAGYLFHWKTDKAALTALHYHIDRYPDIVSGGGWYTIRKKILDS